MITERGTMPTLKRYTGPGAVTPPPPGPTLSPQQRLVNYVGSQNQPPAGQQRGKARGGNQGGSFNANPYNAAPTGAYNTNPYGPPTPGLLPNPNALPQGGGQTLPTNPYAIDYNHPQPNVYGIQPGNFGGPQQEFAPHNVGSTPSPDQQKLIKYTQQQSANTAWQSEWYRITHPYSPMPNTPYAGWIGAGGKQASTAPMVDVSQPPAAAGTGTAAPADTGNAAPYDYSSSPYPSYGYGGASDTKPAPWFYGLVSWRF